MKNIYIYDMGAYSGGGAAMYQLGCDLIDRGFNVYIAIKNEGQKSSIPKKFTKYYEHGLKQVLFDQLEDKPENIIIVPESCTEILFNIREMKKIIYWLSYEFYDGKYFYNKAGTSVEKIIYTLYRGIKRTLHFIKNVLRNGHIAYPLEDVLNLSGSWYASAKLMERGIDSVSLFHPIGEDFLDEGEFVSVHNRKDIVLYNPAKPSRLTKRLVRRQRYNYIPIQGLSFTEMLNLFRHAKLYIDFGNFPGPERIPKETALNGVNVLVWRLHAAVTDDVLIPSKYKIPVTISAKETEKIIGKMLKEYTKDNKDFNDFRNMILDMPRIYEQQLNYICETYLK